MRKGKQEVSPSLRKEFEVVLGTEQGDLFFEVPFDVKQTFGRARPPVIVTLSGHSYRSTVFVYGGRYYVPVNKEHREAAGVNVGDTLHVILELDTAPRTVEAPPDLAAALAENAEAKAAWERLSPSHRREHVEYILEAKKPETRQRRVEKSIELLLGAGPTRGSE